MSRDDIIIRLIIVSVFPLITLGVPMLKLHATYLKIERGNLWMCRETAGGSMCTGYIPNIR